MGCAVSLPIVAAASVAWLLYSYNFEASTICRLLRRHNFSTVSANQAVFITGCDSGLGYSLALHAHKLGFTVLAGCLHPDGEGGKQLLQLCSKRLHVLGLDVTSGPSVHAALKAVENILARDKFLELKALINNAGVMIFGEFEWLTEQHIQSQINVNLLGTMRVTKSFCPLLRKYKGRIITISSHCAAASLPGLSVYGATKAGLAAWCDALRVEQAKYGVRVISYVPGSFVQHSNIMVRQPEYAREMEEAMTPDDHQFFGDYFRRYNEYLCAIPTPGRPVPLPDDKIHSVLEEALLSKYPYSSYTNETPRYKWYHFMFKISPAWLRDRLVKRFIKMPEF
ncbi:D-beta-hydroxybutyrate dehydrogenase, mitochondrial [Cryptotermes secundus]|uniref:D-beta-hydroxybutyrate dehydrogenase, mitochondrial n=1 Tax=Cryptotermes secundus TaxID=105785 RepID=UPI000CD7B609|nr:D-beta-hydroxybutyrate dehydrogenase, mitochondrial [Cryptotermes secundus]XP_023703613.1 D-beta-hydroxybutyrate dehydrogenase, mitochondrial [Cryptotermes secundus]XP_033606560.1 D-beta-hydroxybutyrate dehydrogenase, mitochondrial [Cryptotermes secundus]